MTKTERTVARLLLVENQRRFAWEIAREEYVRSAARMIAGKTHDLLSLVQVVQLAAPQLAGFVENVRVRTLEPVDASLDDARVFVEDIARVADDAHIQLKALMALARPPRRPTTGDGIPRGAAVGPIVGRVIGELDGAVDIGVDYAVDVDAATALDERALAHLAIGLVLDVADAPWIELTVRDREIEGAPWIELVRGTATDEDGDHFDLRLVHAITARGGGDVTRIERPDGGVELVVALPMIA
jgi:hypothetical protein